MQLIFLFTSYTFGQSETLAITITAEMLGNMETCACPRGNIPGIGQRVYAYKSIGKNHPSQFFFDGGDLVEDSAALDKTKAHYLILCMNEIGYSAMNLGERDVALGIDFLKQLEQTTNFPLLSANLISKKSGKPIFTPSMIKTIHSTDSISQGKGSRQKERDINICIIGILGDEYNEAIIAKNPEVEVISPSQVIQDILNNLQDDIDIIVILAHTKTHKAKRLLQQFPQINLVVASDEKTTAEYEKLTTNGKEQYFAVTASNAMSISSFPFVIGEDGSLHISNPEIIPVSPDLPSLPKVEKIVEEYRKKVEELFIPKTIKSKDEITSSSNASDMRFYEIEYDFGTVNTTDAKTHDFVFLNCGRTTLEIEKIRSTCECLKVHLVSDKIPSMQESKIILTLEPDKYEGVLDKLVYVHSNDTERPVIILKIKAKLPMVAEVTPKQIDFGRMSENKKVTATVHVKWHINDEVRIEKIETSRDILKASFQQSTELKHSQKIELTLESAVALGEINEEVILHTSSKKKPIIYIPVTATIGEVKGQLVASLFYSRECLKCKDIFDVLLPRISRQYGSKVAIKKYNIDEIKNYELMIKYEKQYGSKENEPVKIFFGNTYIAGEKAVLENLESKLALGLKSGNYRTDESNINQVVSADAVPDVIVQRFLGFKIFTIISAGLVDGINPCAFATIIFFISLLGRFGTSKCDIFYVGVFFTLAVFLTYLLLGLGLFKSVKIFSVSSGVARLITYGAASFAIIIGLYNFYDFISCLRKKSLSEMKVKLPKSIHKRIHSVMKANLSARSMIIAAIIIGFLVSILESLCTGQMYLPTIIFVLRDASLKLNAFAYLLLYNLMFIIPLVIIFLLVYFGVQSSALTRFAQRNLAITKLLLTLLFLSLGVLLFLVS